MFRSFLEEITAAYEARGTGARVTPCREGPFSPQRPEVSAFGAMNPKHFSTSFVERQNLSLRVGMRHLTRLTNVFSKKGEKHAAAVALHLIHYNFTRVHKMLRITPAMAAGRSDHVWNYGDLAALANQ